MKLARIQLGWIVEIHADLDVLRAAWTKRTPS